MAPKEEVQSTAERHYRPPNILPRYTGILDVRQLVTYTVSYKDIFALQNLYELLREWLIENGYATRDEEKFPEVFYLQRETPGGREIQFRWRPVKQPLWHTSKLFRYDLDIDCVVRGLKDVELAWKGQKIKAEKGLVEISVAAKLVLDYETAWQKTPFFHSFKDLIINRFLKRKIDQAQKELVGDANSLQEAIKTYLKLETYLPEGPQGFWPKAVPE
jgi:hypothetical protein